MKHPAIYLLLAQLFLAGCGQSGDDSTYGIPSGTYAVDPTHAYITFSYLHQDLSYPLLRATSTAGELQFDADDIANSSVDVAIRSDSIRSNVEHFDRELASRKFFNAGEFPYITFSSERFEPSSDTEGVLHGQLTIKNTTMPIQLDVTLNAAIMHPITDAPAIGFSATGSLKRSDFGLDRFVQNVSDDVTVAIEIEFAHGGDENSKAAVDAARQALAGD